MLDDFYPDRLSKSSARGRGLIGRNILVTAPAGEPVTLAEAKAQCEVTHTDHDTMISSFITVARKHIDGPEGWLGRCIVEQTWDLKLDDFPLSNGRIVLPTAPLISVTSVSYVDLEGNTQTWAASNYQVVNGGARRSWIEEAYGKSWPAARGVSDAVTVRYVAGYEADDSGSPVDYTANVPAPIRQAILIMVADLYRYRELHQDKALVGSVEEMPTVKRLLTPYRASWF